MQTIPCPVCKTAIPVEIHHLLRGVKFICPTCHPSMSLAAESHDAVERPETGYDKLKKHQKFMN